MGVSAGRSTLLQVRHDLLHHGRFLCIVICGIMLCPPFNANTASSSMVDRLDFGTTTRTCSHVSPGSASVNFKQMISKYMNILIQFRDFAFIHGIYWAIMDMILRKLEYNVRIYLYILSCHPHRQDRLQPGWDLESSSSCTASDSDNWFRVKPSTLTIIFLYDRLVFIYIGLWVM